MSTAWPNDPTGDMVPILEASVEAAKQRHPSGLAKPPADMLTSEERCDGCPAAAAYRYKRKERSSVLQFCLHHHNKNFSPMVAQGWAVIGGNPVILAALGQEALDHGQL
jgi:hypothetical protein